MRPPLCQCVAHKRPIGKGAATSLSLAELFDLYTPSNASRRTALTSKQKPIGFLQRALIRWPERITVRRSYRLGVAAHGDNPQT